MVCLSFTYKLYKILIVKIKSIAQDNVSVFFKKKNKFIIGFIYLKY